MGYLLHAVEGEERYKIVSFKKVRPEMTAKQKEEFDVVDFDDHDAWLSDERDLFECSSNHVCTT